MAKTTTKRSSNGSAAARRPGTSKLRGRPIDDDGAIAFDDDDQAFVAGDVPAPGFTIQHGPGEITTATAEPDQEFVAAAGKAVLGFLKGLGEFFLTARTIESKAQAALVAAKKLDAAGTPATMDADEAIQHFIKDTTEQKKAAEAHWTITTTVHQFHRRLTARRAIATDALDAANAIGNKLHNAYVAAENKRIADEADRKRRELEAAEQKRRDEEAAAAAKEAEKLEAAAPEVSARETAFINYYLAERGRPGCDARAAQLAGYKDPAASAQRLLASPKILAALEARRQADEIRQQQAAKARAPIAVDVPDQKPQVSRSAGLSSRTTWGATVLDAQLLADAVFVEFGTALAAWLGKPVEETVVRSFLKTHNPSIPRDVLLIDASVVRDYGSQLHEQIDRWPGVVHTKNTKGF
jgi:hypothetical protein